jgi:hypothetical protein
MSATETVGEPTKEFLENWIAALESGEWPKGKAQLCRIKDDEVQFCCLGVAAALHGDLTLPTANDDGYVDKHLGKPFQGKLYFTLGQWSAYGLGYDVMNDLAEINDKSDSFEPVVAHIRSVYAHILEAS